MSDQHQGLPSPPAGRQGPGGQASGAICATTPPPGEIDHIQHLSQDLALLCRGGEFSDVVLVVGDERFHAHRSLLAARSEYFRALLYGGMMESHQMEVSLSDTAPEPFRALLQYIYTGQINLTAYKEDTVLDILGMAHQYGFCQLEEAISHYLEAAVRTSNVCVIYDVACLYQLKPLLSVCQQYMDQHAQAVLQQPGFCQMSPSGVKEIVSRDSFCAPEVDIFKAVKKWAAGNPGVDSKEIIASLRLPLMSMQDLVNVVRPSGIIGADCILDAIKDKVESRDRDLRYRGCLSPDENVCSPRFNAKVVRGDMRHYLLNGDSAGFDMERGFTRHAIEQSCIDNCIEVRLGKQCIINHIKMLLWDKDMRSYSYYIDVSMDEKDWVRVVDYRQYHCRSWQYLYFPARVVRSIRVVGTNNTVNRMFHLVTLEAYYASKTEQVDNGMVVPRENVATLARSAMVIEGVSRSRHALLNGDTQNYDWDHGYTCHQLGSGSIVVQLGQPVLLESMRLLLWDCDDRAYGYYVEVSCDQRDWTVVCDRSRSLCRSWQLITFRRRPVVFVRIVGTRNSANEVFHCVHFECPAQCEVERCLTTEGPEPPPSPQPQGPPLPPAPVSGSEHMPQLVVVDERQFLFEQDDGDSPPLDRAGCEEESCGAVGGAVKE